MVTPRAYCTFYIQTKLQGLRELKRPTQGHTANKGRGQDFNQVLSDTQTVTTAPSSLCVARAPGQADDDLGQKVPSPC